MLTSMAPQFIALPSRWRPRQNLSQNCIGCRSHAPHGRSHLHVDAIISLKDYFQATSTLSKQSSCFARAIAVKGDWDRLCFMFGDSFWSALGFVPAIELWKRNAKSF